MGWSIRVDNTQHVLSISVNARRNVRPAHGTRIQADCRVGRIGKEKDRVKWWCAPIKGLFGTLPASSSTKHRDLTHIIVIALQRVHNHNAINQQEKQWQIRVGKKGWNMVLFGFLFLFPFRCGCELRSIISWRARLINCSPNDDSNITTTANNCDDDERWSTDDLYFIRTKCATNKTGHFSMHIWLYGLIRLE